MKTAAIKWVLENAGEAILKEEAVEAYRLLLRGWRWNQVRQKFPDAWDGLSDRFDAIKDSITGSMPVEEVGAQLVPGGIERYPEIFEPFRQQLASFDWVSEAGAAAIDLGLAGAEAPVEALSEVIDVEVVDAAASAVDPEAAVETGLSLFGWIWEAIKAAVGL